MSVLQAHHQALAGWWTPAQLSSPAEIWADDESAIVGASGAASSWANRGPSGGAFEQPTAGRRPTVIDAALNGLRVLSFDGTNDVMRIVSTAAGDLFRAVGAGWSLTVSRKRALDAAGVWRAIVLAPTAAGSPRHAQMVGTSGVDTNRYITLARRQNSESTKFAVARAVSVGEWVIRTSVVDYAGNKVVQGVNGVITTTSSPFASAGLSDNTAGQHNRISIGGNVSAGNIDPKNPADIDLAAVLMGAGQLSDDDRDRIVGWAAWRYGLQANLPSGHPYKNHAP